MADTGPIIADARRMRGLTQKDVADALGVSVQSVSQWETGKSSPQGSRLLILSELLGVSTAVLLGEKPSRDTPPPPQSPKPIPIFSIAQSLYYVGYVDPERNTVEPLGYVVPTPVLSKPGFALLAEQDGYPTKEYSKGDLLIFERNRKDVKIGDIVYEFVVVERSKAGEGQVLLPDEFMGNAIQARIRAAPTTMRSYLDSEGDNQRLVSVAAIMVEHRRIRPFSDPDLDTTKSVDG